MSTRSVIAATLKDGTVAAVYCHSDGYLDGVGKTLHEHWQDTREIAKLIGLGNLSCLGETVGKRHSFEKKYNSKTGEIYTTAYARDRGDSQNDNMATIFRSKSDLSRRVLEKFDCDWVYLFDKDEEWKTKPGEGGRRRKVSDLLKTA